MNEWPLTGHLSLAELRGPKGAALSSVPGVIEEMQARSFAELRRQLDLGRDLVGLPGEEHVPRAVALIAVEAWERGERP